MLSMDSGNAHIAAMLGKSSYALGATHLLRFFTIQPTGTKRFSF
jgi:hypothetical protein